MNEEWRNEIITKGAAVDAIMERDQYAEPMECVEAIKGLSPEQPERLTDDDFEKQIHAMFDHIWDCEIDHPVFQDTVGDLMEAVIQCHKGLPSAQPEHLSDDDFETIRIHLSAFKGEQG